MVYGKLKIQSTAYSLPDSVSMKYRVTVYHSSTDIVVEEAKLILPSSDWTYSDWTYSSLLDNDNPFYTLDATIALKEAVRAAFDAVSRELKTITTRLADYLCSFKDAAQYGGTLFDHVRQTREISSETGETLHVTFDVEFTTGFATQDTRYLVTIANQQHETIVVGEIVKSKSYTCLIYEATRDPVANLKTALRDAVHTAFGF
jgi:hypothetical protein